MYFDDVEMRRMDVDQLKPNAVIRGPLFSEPVQVAATIPMGNVVKMLGKWLKTGQFRLGIEALRIGLAYEYDPYFALSIARIDPLTHQLEAV